MPDDILNDTPPAVLPTVGGHKKVTCEFCECELGQSGEYKKLSEKARKFRKLEEENEKLDGTIATLRTEKEHLEARLREMTGAKKGSWF